MWTLAQKLSKHSVLPTKQKSKIHIRTCRSTMAQPQNFMEILSLLFNLKPLSLNWTDNAERHQENATISHFTMVKNCFLTYLSSDVSHILWCFPFSASNSPTKTPAIHKHRCGFFQLSMPFSSDTKCLFPNSTFQIPLSFKLYLKIYFLYEMYSLNLFPLIFLCFFPTNIVVFLFIP